MPSAGDRELCAFVRIEGNADSLLALYGGRSLARFGNLHVASIPLRSLSPLSLRPEVSRIEARQGNSIQMDTTLVLLGGAKAHAGELLPQAFTGRGVVVGVQDIGFDLTHPNFYDTSLSEYRIKRMWDFLSLDTLGSDLYVGAEYTTEEALKTYAHSRDAHIISHGTHTLGCAAGSGYDTSYRGMAPGSDICLVSNAVTEDISQALCGVVQRGVDDGLPWRRRPLLRDARQPGRSRTHHRGFGRQCRPSGGPCGEACGYGVGKGGAHIGWLFGLFLREDDFR